MGPAINEVLWHRLTAEVTSGMREWRAQHPKATLREIEIELDTRLHGMRARMLEDLALQSAAATWEASAAEGPPTCPQCHAPLQGRGRHARTLTTEGGQTLTLERDYGVCPACGAGLFPPG